MRSLPNRSHTSGRDAVNTGTEVLDNGTSATLDGEDTGNLADNVCTVLVETSQKSPMSIKLTLGRSPAAHLASELDTNDLRGLKLPGKTSHDIDGVSSTDTNGGHTKTTSVGSVRVGTDHETTGESVVLKDDLVNDTGTGLPETDVVLGARGAQEVVDLPVDVVGAGQVLLATDLGLNQVVTVDGGRSGDAGHAGAHELEDGHLGGGILASNSVGAELEVAGATLDLLTVGVVQVRVENLLSEGERPVVQPLPDNAQVLAHLLVVDKVALLGVGHLDLLREGGVLDGRKGAAAHGARLRRACQPGGSSLVLSLGSLEAAPPDDLLRQEAQKILGNIPTAAQRLLQTA